VIEGNLVQQNNKSPNKLEVAECRLLDTLKIEYLAQVLICKKFVVDVLIPELNIVIQWDGDYWHGYDGIKDARQKKRCNLDKSQDAYMKKAGYTVIRFWEHDVKDAKDIVIKKIQETVTNAAQLSSDDFEDLII
jgi:very-short-patch-repair endonuclease